jgi:hypothetical protein
MNMIVTNILVDIRFQGNIYFKYLFTKLLIKSSLLANFKSSSYLMSFTGRMLRLVYTEAALFYNTVDVLTQLPRETLRIYKYTYLDKHFYFTSYLCTTSFFDIFPGP